MADMTPALRQYTWRTTQEAMNAVIATMRDLVESTDPVLEPMADGTLRDYRADALRAIAEMEWLWLADVDMIVTQRLVEPS